MSELTGIVYAEFKSVDLLNEFNTYFDFDTRPRFIEDAPSGQSGLVEIAEFIEYPQEIKDSSSGRFYFYWFEGNPDDTLKVIGRLGAFFKADKLVAYVQNDEEYKEYFQLFNGKLKSLYLVGEDESPAFNLEVENELERLEYDERALAYIVQYFIN